MSEMVQLSEAAFEEARARAQEAVRSLRGRIEKLDDAGLDLILREARSHYAWTERPVTDEDIRVLYETIKFGATSTNGNHARFVFVKSEAEKKRLAACVDPGNHDKLMGAPVTVIVAYDTAFWTHLPRLFPHRDMTFKIPGQRGQGRSGGLPQFHPAGRLSDDCGPCAGPGCRGDVRLFQCQGG